MALGGRRKGVALAAVELGRPGAVLEEAGVAPVAEDGEGEELRGGRRLQAGELLAGSVGLERQRKPDALDVLGDPCDQLDHRKRPGHEPQSHPWAECLAQGIETDYPSGLIVHFSLHCKVAAGSPGRGLLEAEEIVGIIFKDHEVKALSKAQAVD